VCSFLTTRTPPHTSPLSLHDALPISVAHVFAAGQKTEKLDHVKKSVAKLGVGSKARATITLNNGAKVKGYVYSAGDEEFVIRDRDRKSTRLNSSHGSNSYAVFCLEKT